MPTSTRSPEAVLAKLTEYAQRFPALARLQELGTTHEGRPILCLCIGRDVQASDPRPSMFLNGAHHGGELASIDVVMDAIETLLGQTDDPRISRFLDELCIFCVPQVNPDGVYSVLHDLARGDRKNARDNNDNHRVDEQDGVDLNRNYPFRWGSLGESGSSKDPKSVYYRGPAAASEPETQAMMRLAEREHPTASISYHTGTVAILAPYTIPGAQSPEPNEAWEVAAALAAAMPPHPQGRNFAVQKNLYPVDGTDQDWLRHGFGTLALILECARSNPKSADERVALVRAVRDSWMFLFDRFLNGPSISGSV
ncbi:M14 family zinc carboxypeptidase, partial [Haliangium sp. UPWRP_2]|uniref:M14 family zinc carboxypeptidase n=1 Tax=Haliangium sp. UPWRP_2 TaxID=1931276 RepID=UPI0011B2312D